MAAESAAAAEAAQAQAPHDVPEAAADAALLEGGMQHEEGSDDEDGLFLDAQDDVDDSDDEEEEEEVDEQDDEEGEEELEFNEPAWDDPSHTEWVVVDPVEDAGLGKHGCDHYRRRCRLVAPCCGEVFWCRHCHNAAKDDGEQDLAKRHALDRKQVQEVECALCDTRQPVGERCSNCGVQFGRYSCMQCNFFDDNTSKKQFHCADCGICRVGGRENFFHCSTCNCCYSLALQESHVCVQNSMHQNCPVCFEYLFDSVRPITVLPCGHTIHQECYHGLVTHDSMSLCPICMRCTLNPAHRERMWRDVDLMISRSPMPPEHAGRRVNVLCNDCQQRSNDAPFHYIGNKCSSCGGYNTRLVS